MPIIDLQRRLREAGRIRIGEQVPTGKGKTRPAKLDTFRLTSADDRALGAAASCYGGDVRRWEGAPVGEQFELYTDVHRLPVIIPPGDSSFSQWWETWSGGGCQRRCDGRWEVIGDQACVCDPQNRDCKPHTRLSVILADLPGIGVWRVDTQGYYAATELAGTIDVVKVLAERGQMIDAWLVLEQRQVKRPGQATRNFGVVALDLDLRVRELIAPSAPAAALDGGPRFEPIPPEIGPAPSVAEQAAVVEQPSEVRPRRNGQVPLKATGLAPRTVAEAAGAVPAGEEPFESGPHPEMAGEAAVLELGEQVRALSRDVQGAYNARRREQEIPTVLDAFRWTAEHLRVAQTILTQVVADAASRAEASDPEPAA